VVIEINLILKPAPEKLIARSKIRCLSNLLLRLGVFSMVTGMLI
jgi:hypothetical protein